MSHDQGQLDPSRHENAGPDHQVEAPSQAKQTDELPRHDHLDGDEDPEVMPSNLEEKIEPFDFEDLENRYHEAMNKQLAEERQIMARFNDLCQYFESWATASTAHESNRGFQRLKTQIAYVGEEENNLEQRRAHYVKVTSAFQQALLLLQD